MIRDDRLGGDFYSTNPRDPGMRVVLPGSGTELGTYFVRVRSQPEDGDITNTDGGLTRGEYQLQIRLRQVDEKGGSNVRFANILYPETGIHARGLPGHSPLTGEASEVDDVLNNTLVSPGSPIAVSAQDLGNLLETDRNTISVAGSLSSASDIDWYQIELTYEDIQAITGVNDAPRAFAAMFDLDYADQLNRADAVLSIYDESGRLIFIGRDSNVLDDQPLAGQANDFDDLSRGSLGLLDPFIGPVDLPAEVPSARELYYIAVSSNLQLPSPLDQTFNPDSETKLVRLEPIPSLRRVVEDHIGDSLQFPRLGYTTGDDLVGTQPDGFRQILPDTPEILDLNFDPTRETIPLEANVIPFTLADVQLYASSGNSIVSVNPFDANRSVNGGFTRSWYTVVSGAPSTVGDIDMRPDGRLFRYYNAPAGNDADAGNIQEIDVGSGVQAPFTPDDDEIDPNNVTSGVTALTFRLHNSATDYSWRGVATQAGSSVLVGDRTNPTDRNNGYTFSPITNITGQATGIAYNNDHRGTLYGVSSGGDFFRFFGDSSGTNNVLTNFGVSFSGLTLGPQNVEIDPVTGNGRYASLFFATTSTGEIHVIDPTNPANNYRPDFFVFDSDGDGTADAHQMDLGVGGLNGLAFSRTDFNLWHPTTLRGSDAGHGIRAPFDASRDANSGNWSFYFGVEEASNATYRTYPGQAGQVGIVKSGFQTALTLGNNSIGDDYNVPGGAHGQLQTDPFSLQGYSRTDKPTLYFNYYLDTETRNSPLTMRDSARVFVSRDDGASWEQIATNNSDPSSITSPASPTRELPVGTSSPYITTSRDAYPVAPNQRVQELFDNGEDPNGPNTWRQARIDLADFAGEPNLKLRFDFATAGAITADQSMPGDRFGAAFGGNRAANNDFEGFYIDDIIVGFAERGELVTGPGDQTNRSDYFQLPQNPVFGAPPQSLIGEYQLEIRRGTEFIGNDVIKFDFNDPTNPVGIGQPLSPIERTSAPGSQTGVGRELKILTTFDTNERFVDSFTLIMPPGNVVVDGDSFSISDGLNTQVFEFDSNNTTSGEQYRHPVLVV